MLPGFTNGRKHAPGHGWVVGINSFSSVLPPCLTSSSTPGRNLVVEDVESLGAASDVTDLSGERRHHGARRARLPSWLSCYSG